MWTVKKAQVMWLKKGHSSKDVQIETQNGWDAGTSKQRKIPDLPVLFDGSKKLPKSTKEIAKLPICYLQYYHSWAHRHAVEKIS